MKAIDRSGWGAGPWEGEPDRCEWTTVAGLPAIAQRVSHGAWCGYVAVPLGHPFHGRDGDSVDLEVHGGITYSQGCHGAICHEPELGEPDNVWWFGFDTVHYGDIAPGIDAIMRQARLAYPDLGEAKEHGVYRTLEYVRGECESLATQLTSAGGAQW